MNFKVIAVFAFAAVALVASAAANPTAGAAASKPAAATDSASNSEAINSVRRDLIALRMELQTAGVHATSDIKAKVDSVSSTIDVLIKRVDKLERKIKEVAASDESIGSAVKKQGDVTETLQSTLVAISATVVKLTEQQSAMAKALEAQMSASPALAAITDKVRAAASTAGAVLGHAWNIVNANGGVYIQAATVYVKHGVAFAKQRLGTVVAPETLTVKGLQEKGVAAALFCQAEFERLRVLGIARATALGVPAKHAPMLVQSLLIIGAVLLASILALAILAIVRFFLGVVFYVLCCRCCAASRQQRNAQERVRKH